MAMTWEDLLFAHWRVPVDLLRALLPKGLELDLYRGEAWLSVVPFRMSHVHGRFLPSLPGLSGFPETNVRTYVTRKGAMPGVYFFSLDAANFVAVRAARRFFHLPYFDAEMSVRGEEDGFRYSTRRTHAGAAAGELSVSYAPVGPIYRSTQGTVEDWLTARYCLYAADAEGGIHRCDIHHQPWRLQAARADIRVNTLGEWLGFPLDGETPLLQFAKKTVVAAWMPQRLE